MSTEHFITINDIRYHVRIEGNGSPVLLLHGFTGSADTWSGLMEAYKEQYSFIAVDLLGHGQTDSPEHHGRYGMEAAADDLKVLLNFLGRKPVHLLGYSMGGRLALGFAVRYPEYVKSLILESSSPGLKTIEEQDVRKMHDAALAGRILDIGVERFTDEWSRLPLFATQERLPQEAKERVRAERLAQKAIGLAGSLKGMGTGSQPSLWEDLASLQIPVLVLAGELDLKFVRIAKQMADTLPNHEMHIFEDAGHAIHVEKPAEFGRIVNEYLKGGSIMAIEWVPIRTYDEILYEKYNGIAKITINRPEVRNAFTPKTVMELIDAFSRARDDKEIGVIILTGAGDLAFCSGGDQKVRGHGGYVGDDEIPRLNVLDLQRLIRVIPKPVVAMVAGYAIGGGHVLHVVCDLTIAAENARFGQTGPNVGSFDAGYGAGYLARIVGHKKAKEIWYLCRQYDAQEALEMGLVNKVVPLEELEKETVEWCEIMLEKSPTALRFLKASFNADTDGLAGLQQLAGDATLLYYTTDEAKEGRDAFKEKRKPDFGQFPRFP